MQCCWPDNDGIVTSVRAEPGQVVAAGQAVITQALANEIEASVAVSEQEVVKLRPGGDASIALWSAPSVKSEGKIREIAGAADAASRTYGVRVTIAHPAPEMRLGMTASVSFHLPQDTASPIVPLAALTQRDGKTMAYIADREIANCRGARGDDRWRERARACGSNRASGRAKSS